MAAGCMELTLELSQNKWPPAEHLPSIWADNRLAMANLPITAVFGGLRCSSIQFQSLLMFSLGHLCYIAHSLYSQSYTGKMRGYATG